MSSLRFLALAGTLPLLGIAAPAHAVLTSNSLTTNALTQNSLTVNSLTCNSLTVNSLSSNALPPTASAVAELNGVAVEGISLPQGTRP